jgi:UrcA family protein
MKALLILSALVAGTAAAAQPVTVIADAPRTERVSFADLDLTSAAGVVALQDRVRTAATRLCIENGVQPLSVKLAGKACFNAAYADGLDQMSQAVDARRAGVAIAGAAVSVRGR